MARVLQITVASEASLGGNREAFGSLTRSNYRRDRFGSNARPASSESDLPQRRPPDHELSRRLPAQRGETETRALATAPARPSARQRSASHHAFDARRGRR